MNMNIQDINYNKYIKYKTKYLELKELSGGGMFGWLKKTQAVTKTVAPVITVPAATAAYFNNVNIENKLYGEEGVRLINEFFKPFNTTIQGDKTSSIRKSSLNDINAMYSELNKILNEIKNEIKKVNTQIENLDSIIDLINNSHNDMITKKLSKDIIKYNDNYKNKIYEILDSHNNKKISNFTSLKIVINTYLYLMFHYNLGDFTKNEIQAL